MLEHQTEPNRTEPNRALSTSEQLQQWRTSEPEQDRGKTSMIEVRMIDRCDMLAACSASEFQLPDADGYTAEAVRQTTQRAAHVKSALHGCGGLAGYLWA